MIEILSLISLWAIPVIIALILVSGLIKKIPIYESFIDGAKEGVNTVVMIIPHLVGMLVAISVFRASGALEWILALFMPLLDFFHVPGDILPQAFLRPITGSGSLGVMLDIFQQHGPDSFVGRLASVMQGSTDTTLYILTVYFGAVGIRKYKYALKVGLLADLAGILAAIAITFIMFKS